jgi:glycerol-3-phosphate acyltransferase PlsY
LSPAVFLVLAYLTGAFPTSSVAARATRGIDLRMHGSGNLGATNVYRVLGWRVALPVMIVDILKGWFPAAMFVHWDTSTTPEWSLAYGAAAILGHVFSPYVGFRGGKGVATGGGVFLALMPLAMLGSFVVWCIVLFASRIVSLASIAAALSVPLFVLLLRGSTELLGLATGLCAFVIYSHRANIRRLARGEEHRFVRGVEAP